MVLEKATVRFLTSGCWAAAARSARCPGFLITCGGVWRVLALLVGFVVALVRYGPLKAGDITYHVVTNGFSELARTSPRRVWALARLAIKESFRRRVVVALVVFFLILLFAGWFLKTDYPQPAKLLFSFVLTATTYLVLMIALLLSTFQPAERLQDENDLHGGHQAGARGRHRAGPHPGLHDRRHDPAGDHELVSATCSSCGRSTTRTKSTLPVSKTSSTQTATSWARTGRTTLDDYHRHEVELDADGNGDSPVDQRAHSRDQERRHAGRAEVRRLRPGRICLRARVPQYGLLRFLDRRGAPAPRGISVGNEWTYRSFIEGGTAGRRHLDARRHQRVDARTRRRRAGNICRWS